ncbi:MAG: hypothetical protein RBT80_27215 [Candidatus Vecturithrix sp.]|jgi:hypothetical protein|nr:hypothetical protein [Candidatus Vecturithrix sp.]
MISIKDRIERINQEISGVSSLFNITSWEKDFLKSTESRSWLSDKQESILKKIEEKVFEAES